MNYAIAFFDLDGTIVNPETGAVPAAVAEAIRRMQSFGTRVFACTGRCVQDTLAVQQGFCFDGFASFGGAIAKSGSETLWRSAFGAEETERMLEAARRADYPMVFWTEQGGFCQNPTPELERLCGSPLSRLQPASLQPLLQLQVFLPEGQEWRLMDAAGRLQYNRWNRSFFDVFAAGVSKRDAVERILAHYFIPREQAIAFGDGEVDIGMFGAVGTAVCMAESTANVRARAHFVAGSAAAEGVLPAIRRYFPELGA